MSQHESKKTKTKTIKNSLKQMKGKVVEYSEYSTESSSETIADLKSMNKKTDEMLKELNIKKDSISEYISHFEEQELWKKGSHNVGEKDLNIHWKDGATYRFQEEGSNKVETYPRRIEGGSRINVTGRARRRKEKQQEKKVSNEYIEKLYKEHDEKWKKIYIENGEKFTEEQLKQYTDELGEICLLEERGTFKYQTLEGDFGGNEKAIQILTNESADKDGEYDSYSEEEDEKEIKKNRKMNKRGNRKVK